MGYIHTTCMPWLTCLWCMGHSLSLGCGCLSAGCAQMEVDLRYCWSSGLIYLLARPFGHKTRRSRQRHSSEAKIVLASCVLLPLFFLSCAPHQEPRFLLPVLPALALLVGPSVLNSSRWLMVSPPYCHYLFFLDTHLTFCFVDLGSVEYIGCLLFWVLTPRWCGPCPALPTPLCTQHWLWWGCHLLSFLSTTAAPFGPHSRVTKLWLECAWFGWCRLASALCSTGSG